MVAHRPVDSPVPPTAPRAPELQNRMKPVLGTEMAKLGLKSQSRIL